MTLERTHLTDEFLVEMLRSRGFGDASGILGIATIERFNERGRCTHRETVHNLITDAGDLYYAQKAIVAIGPANPSAPTAMNGMKLGTGGTAVAKNGAGAALVTYLAASNLAFDATYASFTNLGAGAGVTANYKTTWGAGVATNGAITEAAIVNDQATNATTSAANTASRILFTSVNKGASDTLAITWQHKFLGA